MSSVFRKVKLLDETYHLEPPFLSFEEGEEYLVPPAMNMEEDSEVFSSAPLTEVAVEEKAARIVIEAEEQRLLILEEAKREAYKIREQAYEEGFEEGRKTGQETGVQLMNEADRTREERLIKLLTSIHRERERLLWEAEGELLELSVDIARQIVLSELKVHRDAIVDVVKAGLRRLTNKQGLVIRVSPDDKSILLEHKDELQASEDLLTLTIVGDPQLKIGDCILETTSGSVDGRLETRLSEAKKLIRKQFNAWQNSEPFLETAENSQDF